jgi:CRISPR-associated RAMP protein (TIGR02581 family)
VRAVASEQARDLLEIEDVMRDRIGLLAQRLRRNRNIATADQTFHNDVIDLSTLIELTFGAPWIAGRVFFKDAHVDETLWFDQWEVRNGVALNRDTETVEQGHLYNYEVVPAGVRFGFELLMENAEPWQLGMVLLALKPWERGEVQIGGFRSRGLGHVRLTNVERRFYELRRGNVDDLLALVGYDQSPVGTLVDEQHAAPWYAAFRDELIARADQGAPQGVGDA